MSQTENLKPIEILLVEDNPGDVRLTKEALKESEIKFNLNVVEDGVEALNYLYKIGEYSEKPRPGIILLDLNMPKKDGREVLTEIKNKKSLKRIPIIVLTTSKAYDDIINAYTQQANCYIIKLVDMFKFIEIIKKIEDFWFGIVSLPSNGNNN